MALNSYKGSIYTDKGSWSAPAAMALDKEHGLCTKHESTAIPGASAGHGDKHQQCMCALNALIYRYTSIEKLEEKFEECRVKYGHVAATAKFLKSLQGNKKKLCRAYTQYIFSFNHTSTQRSEGFNDRIKGKKDMIAFLTNANLVSLHDHIYRLSIETDAKCVKELVKIRKADKRWAPVYESEVETSIMLCTMNVTACEIVDESIYTVTDDDDVTSTVNLDTKIVHRGHVYIIPTCTCGYWCSSFRMCKCIIKALRADKRDVWIVTNIHPIHLVQFHPMWPEALNNARRQDYDDFSHLSMAARLGESAINLSFFY